MRVISKKTIETYYEAHPDCRGALLAWYERITATEWADFNHLKRGFPSVDFVGNNHYVFNIRGNSGSTPKRVDFNERRRIEPRPSICNFGSFDNRKPFVVLVSFSCGSPRLFRYFS